MFGKMITNEFRITDEKYNELFLDNWRLATLSQVQILPSVLNKNIPVSFGGQGCTQIRKHNPPSNEPNTTSQLQFHYQLKKMTVSYFISDRLQ